MLVDLFDFKLSKHLIAQEPVRPRDSAKLLEIKKNGQYYDHTISYLPSLLHSNDLLIFNDTKVIPARLVGKRDNVSVEVTLHKRVGEEIWRAFAKPARKLDKDDLFIIADDFEAVVKDKFDGGEVELEFNLSGEDFNRALSSHGIMPLPPYIRRKSGAKEEDKHDYQTIFACNPGAVAAPTAGLHFTKEMFEEIEALGIKHCFVTLHVGAGTFLPVKTNDTEDHVMHSENYNISKETADLINQTKQNGGRIVAVGTTSLRTLEAASDEDGKVRAEFGETDLFITPGYQFRIVDTLLTNFHLPRSTLFMLVCAFAGVSQMHNAYRHAINSKYRFFSYGDACLLHRIGVI